MRGLRGHGPSAMLTVMILCAAPLAAVAQSESPSTDAEMTERVKTALAADAHLLARHIDVTVRKGVVHLRGFVESDEDLKLVLKDARAVPGVVSVDNQMELKRAPSRGNGT